MRRAKVIFNPISGTGFTLRPLPAFVKELQSRGFLVDVVATRRAGDAEQVARELPAHYSVIVSAGGDGTLNEIINGLHGRRVPVAIFPSGTANVLAKELLIPKSINGIAEMIDKGRLRTLDVGIMGGRRFLLVGGVGFDAQVAALLARARRGHIGLHTYMAFALLAFHRYDPPRLRVSVDGSEIRKEASFVVVANTRSYGGPLEITPMAVPDDGLFDVCVFMGVARQDLVRYFLGALTRRLPGFRDVSYFRGKRVEVFCDRKVPVQVDGEPAGMTPVRFELEPASADLVVPGASS